MSEWVFGAKKARRHFEEAGAYAKIEATKHKDQWRCAFNLPIKGHTIVLGYEVVHDFDDIHGAAAEAELRMRRELVKRLKSADTENAYAIELVIKDLNESIGKNFNEDELPFCSENNPGTFLVRKKKTVLLPKSVIEASAYEDAGDDDPAADLNFEDDDFIPQEQEDTAAEENSHSAKEGSIVLIAGPSGSGKTTLANMLSSIGYRKVTTCTTRPMREGEKEGVDYFFLSDDEFDKRKADGFFLETAVYRGWKYGTPASLPDEGCCIVLTPAGVRKAVKRYPSAVVVFLKPDRRTCLIRMLMRGDDVDEACRRSMTDIGQFDAFEDEADFVLEGDLTQSAAYERVIAFLEGHDFKKKPGVNDAQKTLDEIYALLGKVS